MLKSQTRYLIVSLLTVLVFPQIAGMCKQAGLPAEFADIRWRHAHEEDANGWRCYRPQGHKLPPSRGRHAFRLMLDGSFEDNPIGPADNFIVYKGQWELLKPSREDTKYRLKVETENQRKFYMHIHALTDTAVWLQMEHISQ